MVLIGENIHIIAKAVSDALKDRNKKVIQDLALAQPVFLSLPWQVGLGWSGLFYLLPSRCLP